MASVGAGDAWVISEGAAVGDSWTIASVGDAVGAPAPGEQAAARMLNARSRADRDRIVRASSRGWMDVPRMRRPCFGLMSGLEIPAQHESLRIAE
jgi:hypothetical protein